MSFYTQNKPRLVQSDVYHSLLKRKFYNKMEDKKVDTPYIDLSNFFSGSLFEFFKNNWSFLLILSILIAILIYRYNVIKEDQEMKKARKQYIDQLIMDNYRKEKRLELERENNNTEFDFSNNNMEDEILVNETIDENQQNIDSYSQETSFNEYFNSKIDQSYEPFYGNSSFAPF